MTKREAKRLAHLVVARILNKAVVSSEVSCLKLNGRNTMEARAQIAIQVEEIQTYHAKLSHTEAHR